MKADEKVTYEENDKVEKEKYTNFEELVAKVEQLQNQVERIVTVLEAKGYTYITKERIGFDITDETYKQLEEE